MRFFRYLITFIILLYMNSCDTSGDSISQSIAGNYFASDGSIITLMSDSTFICKQLNFANIYHEEVFKNKKINLSGKWTVENNLGRNRIFFLGSSTYLQNGINLNIFNNGNIESGKVSFTIEIGGGGDLFFWQGDPDENKKYSFVKKE